MIILTIRMYDTKNSWFNSTDLTELVLKPDIGLQADNEVSDKFILKIPT